MVDASTFDFKSNFPIAGIADLYANRSYKEAQMRAQQQQQLVEGMKTFGAGVDSLVTRRMAMAQALAQAQILQRTPQLQNVLGDQKTTPMPDGTMGITPGTSVPTDQLQSAVMGTSGENFLKNIQDPTVDMQVIDALTGQVTPLGKVKKDTKSFMVPRANPIPSEYTTPDGQPLTLDPRTNTYKIAGTPNNVPVVTKKGDESSITDATLLANQIPNIPVMFDAYRNSKSPRLQATPAGRLMDPVGKQAENSLKLAAFTFGGKNLTANEKDVVFGALFPSVTDNEESRTAKETLLTDYMTGKIDLLQAANLLGPAGSKMRSMLSKYKSDATLRNQKSPQVSQKPQPPSDLVHLSTKELLDLKKKLTAHKDNGIQS